MDLLKTNDQSTEFTTSEISLTKTILCNASYPIKAEQALKQQMQIKCYFIIVFFKILHFSFLH